MPYDMTDVIHAVADEHYFLEVQEYYARTSCMDLPDLTAVRSESSPISPRTLPGVSTSRVR